MNRNEKLEDLYNRYQDDSRFNSLRRYGINFVPGNGPVNPTIMLIGEAPGRMENAKRVPFVGPAGRNLRMLLGEAKIQKFDVFLTNVIKYWPRDEDNGKTRQPTDHEVEAARSYLREEIAILQPKLVGLCGRFPLKAIYPEKTEIYSNHGKLLDNMYVPLYHPAVLLYDPSKEQLLLEGYKKLQEYLNVGGNLKAS